MKLLKPILPLFFFFLSLASYAQINDSRLRERIEAQKVAFFTDQLALTAEEAQTFWPIYNQYEATLRDVRKNNIRPIRLKIRNQQDLSEAEANRLLQDLISAETKKHDAKLQLFKDLKGVISPQRIIQLNYLEDQFNKRLLDRFRELTQKRNKRRGK